MCGVTLMHKIPADEIRRRAGVKDVIENIYGPKTRWAGHVARLNDKRWTSRVTYSYSRETKRPRGRPQPGGVIPLENYSDRGSNMWQETEMNGMDASCRVGEITVEERTSR
ncbi:hypothetical protein V3C99_015390 [Haemonchus contortus]|uniref:Transposase n=1 Tax=Haemonchus contortus TaxID=6289 RepID=A0A7I4YVT1_HAECO